MPCGVREDVGRLEVAVDDAPFVQRHERVQDLERETVGLVNGERAAIEPRSERLPLEELIAMKRVPSSSLTS